jgi:phage terminase small subunit
VNDGKEFCYGGRKPKPSALKMFEGNPGKRALNQNEPKPPIETPECPVHLDDEVQAQWNRITPELTTLGLISRIDRAALAAYCQAWSRWVKAVRNEKAEKLFGWCR